MFQIGNLRFLDSYQFLSTSLEELVSLLLKSGKENFVETVKYLGDHDLVFAKGVYPYACMTDRSKFEISKFRFVRLVYRLHFGMRLVVSARTPRPPRRLPHGTRTPRDNRRHASPYSKSLIDPLHPWQSSKKLVPNLMNKQKYVCHYRNLQFYLNHGLKLDKIHRIISLTQSRG